MFEYTARQLCELMGCEYNTNMSHKERIINRCEKFGLKIQHVKGTSYPAKFIIIENNMKIYENEKWIKCPFVVDWEVSDKGRVRRKSTKVIIPGRELKGYITIGGIDSETGKVKNWRVNRLVFFSFHPEYKDNMDTIQIDHIDGCRNNNELTNLRPVSSAFNTQLRTENQKQLKSKMFLLIEKYGYDELNNILDNLLKDDK